MTRTALGAAAILDYTIVFVDTDAGITSLGEVCSVFKRRGALLRSDVDMALAVVGEDPFRIAHLVWKMDLALDSVEEDELAPGIDPVHQLIAVDHGATADTVVVNGRIVMRGGRPTQVDEGAVIAAAQASARGVAQRLNIKPPGMWGSTT